MSVVNFGDKRGPLWKRGQSGNPSGNNMTPEVRKQLNEARKLCAANAEAAVKRLVEFMAMNDSLGLSACKEILDRAGLKAVAIDVETTETDSAGTERVVRVQFVDAG